MQEAASFLNGPLGVFALLLLTGLLLVVADWRLMVLGIGLQSVLLAILATRHSPFEWALLRMITGGLVAIMWYLSAYAIDWGGHPIWWLSWRWPPLSAQGALRLVMVLFVAILLWVTRPWLRLDGIDRDLALLCVWLVAMGLLALSLGNEVLTAGIGLIWWLEAFHLYYPFLEHNLIVEGTVGMLKLVVGLACAYLIVAQRETAAVQPEAARMQEQL